MSSIFRTLGALTKTIAQAMAFAAVMILAIVIYTGFVVPVPQMHPWFSWIRWINPVFYCFESLVANEFHGVQLNVPNSSLDIQPCQMIHLFVLYPVLLLGRGLYQVTRLLRYSMSIHILMCGGIWGSSLLSGYSLHSHTLVPLNSIPPPLQQLNFLFSAEAMSLIYASSWEGRFEGSPDCPATLPQAAEEAQQPNLTRILPRHDHIISWRDVCYDIPVVGGQRRLLNHVSGWVKPGTLTALMEVSGAGKTTLLDVLAQRVSLGVVTGDMLVSGCPLPTSFQRQTGYVQQQDLHSTSGYFNCPRSSEV